MYKTAYSMTTIQKNSTLQSGHRQRLKKRFLREPQYTEDYELLEILLGYGILRKDTKPLAKELLIRFGSLRNVLDARKEELEQVSGFGPGLWTLWQVLRECMARHATSPLIEKEILATPVAVAKAAQRQLAGASEEQCWIALVDAGLRLQGWELLMQGGLRSIPLTPRDVLHLAFMRKAHGFILVHNHPGGSSHASKSDLVLTEELRQLSPRMNLEFIDHIIVTEKECRSIIYKHLI